MKEKDEIKIKDKRKIITIKDNKDKLKISVLKS